jgi:two-component system response regulator YesN
MPYKILLVDDETPVREGIRNRTPWERYGFTVIGEAGNGIEALEIIDEFHPDVVITDIRMPYLDGMELIKQIRYSYPPITIIILSGYDEFTDAQQAIRYDVSEYVLKPVSVEDICNLLERTAKRLDEDIVRMQDQDRLLNAYTQALPLIKEKFLVSLLTSVQQVAENSVIAKAKEYGFDLSGDEFIVATFETDHTQEESPLQAMAMLQVAEEVLLKENNALVFQFENQVIAILTDNSFSQKQYDSVFLKKTFRLAEQLHAYLSKYFSFPITIGLGTLEHSPSAIALSYKQALGALNYSSFYPDQNILFISDLEKPLAEMNKTNFESLCSTFIASVKMGTEEQVNANIDKLFGEQAAALSADGLQSYMLEIIASLNELVENYGYSLISLNDEQEQRNIFSELGTLSTLGKARRWFSRLACTINTTISGQRQNSHIQFVEQAKSLISTHYPETGFGLDQVCDMIAVSPAYFSTTFKRETGLSFVQYLTNARLSRAKELLERTEERTYEIARAVGFAEPNYFSFCFKRYEGVSPSQYRQSHR